MKQYRGLIIGIVAVALAATVFTVADAAARQGAEHAFARQLKGTLALSEDPQVQLRGWPFLLNLATRTFPSATIEASSVPLDFSEQLSSVTVSDVVVSGTDIRPVGNDFEVAHIEGSGKVSYDVLSSQAAFPIRSAGDGKVAVDVTTTGLGSVTATVTGTLSLDTEREEVSIADPVISLAGVEVPKNLSKGILDLATDPIPVSHNMFKVTQVDAEDDGVKVTGEARNLKVTGP